MPDIRSSVGRCLDCGGPCVVGWSHCATDEGMCADCPESLARRFHEAYERLAPSFGYETRKESAVPWERVPENNRRLMIAVCAEILYTLAERALFPARSLPASEES